MERSGISVDGKEGLLPGIYLLVRTCSPCLQLTLFVSKAAQCFRKSGDQPEESLACAYLQRLTAYKLRATNSRDAYIEALDRACDLFLKAGHVDKATECQVDAGNLLAAASECYTYNPPKKRRGC
jgi:hypothetical protein